MQRKPDESAHRKMAELRLACDREIRIQRQRASLTVSSFRQSLHPIRTVTQETLGNREKLGKLRDYLKELEDDLGKALAVKTCKETILTATAESLSTTKARTEELKKIVQDQRARKDEYAAIISQQLLALETLGEKSNQDIIEMENLEEAILWYNRVLGFQTEGGEGVKFIFNKIDMKNPDEEYSFTIRLDGDVYTLLHCDPYMEDVKELIKELNKTNSLFKFVRIMREKFQALALNGVLPTATSVYPDSSTISVSSAPPISVDSRSESLIKQNDPHDHHKDGLGDPPKKFICGRVAIASPQSVSALRRSPRFTVNKLP